MKNFINVVLGKKAMLAVLIIVSALFVVDIVTSLIQGHMINFAPMTVVYSAITVWAVELEAKAQKNQ